MMFWHWLKRILYIGLTLVIIVLTGVTLLLTTHTGGRLTLYAAEQVLPGDFTYDRWQGAILRDFEITDLRYRNGETNIEVDYLQLRWRPWQLLKRQFHARELEVSGVRLQLPEVEPSEPSSEPLFPIELPNVELPFSVRLDQVLLTDIAFQQGELTQQIERIQMRGRTRGDAVHIHSFSLTMPDFHTQLHGIITPTGRYPLNLNTLLRLEVPGYGPTTVVGSLNGDTDSLQLKQQISGYLSAEVDVRVNQPLTEDLNWQGLIRILQSTPDGLVPDVEWLNASLQGSGTLSAVAGEFRIEGKHNEFGAFVASSEAEFANQRFALDSLFLRAESLGLMLDWRGGATINTAENVAQNMADTDIQLSMGGLLRYQDYLDADITLNLHGTPTRLDTFELSAQSNKSQLTLSGNASWGNDLEWDIAFAIDDLLLDRFSTIWPGLNSQIAQNQGADNQSDNQGTGAQGNISQENIDQETLNPEAPKQNRVSLALESSGRWGFDRSSGFSEDNTQIAIELLRLDGELQNEELAVSANLNWLGEHIHIEQLNALWGTQRLVGDIQANLNSTTVNVALSGENLTYENFSIAELSADLVADWSLAQLPTGSLSLVTATQDEQVLVDNLSLVLSEHSDNHHIELQGTALATDIALALNGNWQDQSWQGQIETFSFANEEYENWRLRRVANAVFSREAISIDEFCINNEMREAGLCLAADWNLLTQKGTIDARMDSLQLALLQPILQELIADELNLSGFLDADVALLIEDSQLSIESAVNISDSNIALPQQDLEFRIGASELLRIQGDQNSLTASLDLRTLDLAGGITGQLRVTDALNLGPMDGRVNVQLDNLGIISILVPELQAIVGRINGELGVGGNLAAPVLTGYIEVLEGGGEVPAAGIRVSNLNMRLDAPGEVGEPFSLNAEAQSGDGKVNIAGRYFFPEQRADVEIRGENFQAVQTRELALSISPNLDIIYSADGLRARGELTIPSALITPPDIETIDSSSRDTVIVRGEETVFSFEEESLPIDADIQVILGNNVRVEAFGFDGRLEGRLRVREQPGQQTSAVGTINVATGRYEIFGQPLDIDRGNFTFTGGAIDNPGLDLRVSRSVDSENVSVGARIGGSLREPNLTFFSTPAMQDSAILSYLILGRAPGADSGEANVFAQATLALGMQGGNFIGQQLGQALGVDEVTLDSTGDNLENTSLFIGKHLSSRLYVKYGIGLIEPVNTFFIRYRLTDHLHFETQTSGDRSGADIFYSIER
ncbi:hypothetical protein CWE08_11100 [Aliidiomarina iranensis]|uniref:Translocation and assembly module TamB C-terminal domain-containing protein n=1 Tax=Aliidiomarina iranensis TaxID=1434071 RepID=A0A432VRA4_9GAMM|nr:translocation/assembly module TamB domain-containing protein [Aliidiomarina iranensis]RUO18769.1 hypothetical protein CWE08_11100 [Aliidiomarina iranensis]